MDILEEYRGLREKIKQHISKDMNYEALLNELSDFEHKIIDNQGVSKALFESSKDCIKILDLEGNLLSMSKGGQELLEIKDVGLFLNKSWIDFWKGEDYHKAKNAIEKAREGGIGYFEGYCPTQTGKEKWWGIVISPIYDGQGNINQLLSVSRDITLRKLREHDLRLSNHQLRERVKELNCIFELTKIVETSDSITDILRRLLPILQESWQYPEITEARITLDHETYQTAIFADAKWIQSSDIFVNGFKKGKIDIVYLKERPPEQEGPFLKEERVLLDLIAERIGRVIERIEHVHKYSQLFNTLNDTILKANVEGYIVEANIAAAKLFGYPNPSELIGLHMERLYANPEERKEIIAKLKENPEGEFINIEFRLKRKDGKILETLVNIRLLKNNEGVIVGTLGAIRDITERKRSERELRESENKFINLFQNIPDPIFILEKETLKIQKVNPPVKKNYGYSYKELIGSPFLALDRSGQDSKFKGLIINNSRKRLIFETQHIKKSGESFPVEIHANIFHESEKEMIIAVCRDLTDRKKAEHEEELQELNATKDKFFKIISHDLRSPFNAMMGLLKLLLKNIHKYDRDRIHKQVSVVNQTVVTTYDLLEELLMWAETQSGKISYHPEPLELSNICEEMVSEIINSAINKQIYLQSMMSGKIEVLADIHMLKTIIRNLLTNAIKFTPRNGQVRIDTKRENSHALIVVSDNGVGINKTDQAKLWGLTTAYSSVGTEGEKGTGLGLILCKEFVEKHGGKIWVESSQGKGSDFKFTLPLVDQS